MKINLTSLTEGERTFEFESNSETFDIESLHLDGIIYTSAVVNKVGSQINVNVSVNGKYFLECDRCLEGFSKEFEINFYLIYKFDFNGEFAANYSDDENFKLISPETHYIDLLEDVRDYIILSIPMRKVPEDIDGHCTYCNRNLSEMFKATSEQKTNPVWDKLVEIRKN